MRDWLSIARDSYSASTTYFDANYRKKWEDDIALFQSRHPADSKYNAESYKHRSRLFRPKTRSVTRKNEAAAAAAFFSNVDIVSIEAENEADNEQVIASELMSPIINYRLQKSIPWFLLLIGALQESMVRGIVASYQYWKYRRNADGRVLEDKPCIELIPLENIRFDPGADWLDVVNSTPYLIRQVPKYVCDVKELMNQVDDKTGQPKWKKLDDGEIRQAMVSFDSTRSQREHGHEDPLSQNNAPLKEFEIVWCHENYVRMEGVDYVYWTMGTEHMLTDPKPLDEVYFHGIRPITIGIAVIEAHRAIPDSLVQMGSQLNREANDIVNQRMDNVKLVLNKRWIVKRGKQVDIGSLNKNVAGSVTMADDPEKDVKEVNWPDVTASAYQEQDRINVDYDELTGNFSTSSISSNRQLNETVGGLNLLQGGASALTEYLLRTFVETWVEPVLRQLVLLEQAYETDQVILALAGEKAQLFKRYGIEQVDDGLLMGDLTVRVNVGMGATDPQTKLQKFTLALDTYTRIAVALPNANKEAVRKEIFGLAGYRDGARFFADEEAQEQADAKLQQAEAMIQELQAKINSKEVDAKAKIDTANINADAKITTELIKAESQREMTVFNGLANRAKSDNSSEESSESTGQSTPTQAPAQNMNPSVSRAVKNADGSWTMITQEDTPNGVITRLKRAQPESDGSIMITSEVINPDEEITQE